MDNKKVLLVAAIDLGTTYSGYAFSIKEAFEKDQQAVILNQPWNAGGHQLVSIKTPTVLLLDSTKQIVAFGYQAENRYTELIMDGRKLDDYFYFHRFKMKLYENEYLSDKTEIRDITGKLLPAIDVFALSIRFLKDHLMTSLSTQGVNVSNKAIQWVLTVPSIWTDTAKHFMRQTAVKAGIPSENLIVSLESEAASIFCQNLPVSQLNGADKGGLKTKKGTQYVVVDMGGGTTDITALEHIGKGQLKEISRATGGDCGGLAVDEEFYDIFVKIVGQNVMDFIKLKYPVAFLDLLRAFECVKRSLTPEDTGKRTMSMPFLTLTQTCEKFHDKDFVTVLKASKYARDLHVVNDKLRIESDFLRNLFKHTTDKIVELVKSSLIGISNKKALNVILVGGFSKSKVVQSAIKTGLPTYRVIVPHEASLAVMKGAVIFGYKSEVIVSRMVRFTYGFQVSNDFNPKIHPNLREVEVDGLKLCEKVFEKFLKINTAVSFGQKIQETFTTTKKYQDLHYLPLYTSTSDKSEYTDEYDCKHIGNVVVRIPNPTERYRDVVVDIYFGHTELKVEATDVESGNKCQTSFEYA